MIRPPSRTFRPALLWGLLALTLPAAAIQTFAFQGAAYLEIDGRYYLFGPGDFVADEQGGFRTFASTSLNQCLRRDGSAQLPSSVPLRYGSAQVTRILWLADAPLAGRVPGAELRREGPHWVLGMRSKSGDVLCSGSIAPPPGVDKLHADGFD